MSKTYDELSLFFEFGELVRQNSRLKSQLEKVEKRLMEIVCSPEFGQNIYYLKKNYPNEFEKICLAVDSLDLE